MPLLGFRQRYLSPGSLDFVPSSATLVSVFAWTAGPHGFSRRKSAQNQEAARVGCQRARNSGCRYTENKAAAGMDPATTIGNRDTGWQCYLRSRRLLNC